MVGEIRDGETADIAIKAALTGHLVFSTLHTNDAPSSLTRLMDMGVPNYLVASSCRMILAQRMMRKICPNCKEEINLSPEQVESLRIPQELLRNIRAFRGTGCKSCGDSGTSGRIGVYEAMPITDQLEKAILEKAPSSALRKIALEEGMFTLRMSAVEKMKQGIVSLEEVFAVTSA